MDQSYSAAKSGSAFKWTRRNRAIRTLTEMPSLTAAVRVGMIAERYRMEQSAAEGLLLSVESMKDLEEPCISQPKIARTAEVGEKHRLAVTAALAHVERLMETLPRSLASKYRHVLGEDALAKTQDCLQKVLAKLRNYCPDTGSVPLLGWCDPLTQHGYRYVRRAVINSVLDEHLRSPQRKERRLCQELRADAVDQTGGLHQYLSRREPQLARLWAIFDGLCSGRAAETCAALAVTTAAFGWDADLVESSLFFQAYLDNHSLPRCPGSSWVKAHLAVQLKRLSRNALDQRKYRLKALWLQALRSFHQEVNSTAA